MRSLSYAQLRERNRREPGISHFGFRITNVEEWLATAKRHNPTFGYGGEVRYPHSSSWYVFDPDEREIEVALWDQDAIAF